jgi:acyl-CoA thioester hydrolase
MIAQHEVEFRVRYSETDAMGFLHHANYFNYFEVGRIEMLRAQGGSYAALEAQGVFLVLVKLECRFKLPARFDDLLTLKIELTRMTTARIDHRYQVFRGNTLLAEAESALGCVDRDGRARPLPDEIRQETK